ncbi:MAG: hypothetical protein DSZ28_00425 [Thiothrix sp.]|nr:MAG: hypothetical protein DSZ28_00425 [Thiothrix sp.]
MAKNIVLFSDGTNNQGGSGYDTNVWRLHNMLDTHDNNKEKGKPKQIAFYDDGVGTHKSAPLKLAGLLCGWGLSQNVRDLYVYLASHYEAGDAIYLFGFSRGSFTVRMLANLIDYASLPDDPDSTLSPKQLMHLAKQALKSYKRHIKSQKGDYLPPTLPASDTTIKMLNKVDIRCMGVWDTVNSTGLPINALRKFILPWWVQDSSIEHLPQCVKTGFHALAIDEARESFSPTLWNEKELTKDQYVEQVWFSGVHSNLGGGYPKDSMAQVSLEWMTDRLMLLPKLEQQRKNVSFESGVLRFNVKRNMLYAEANVNGKLYDSRSGLNAFYRYQPRDISRLCMDASGQKISLIHHSVFQRIDNATSFYAPFNIREFRVVDNHVQLPHEVEQHVVNTKDNAGDDSRADILHSVNSRVLLYWVFIGLSITTAILPFFQMSTFWIDGKIQLLSTPIRALGNILPDFLSSWVEWYAAHPSLFLLLLGLFLFKRIVVKKKIENRLLNVARDVWQNLNKELLSKLMGDSKADVSKDLSITIRDIDELSLVGKYFMKAERKVSDKINWRSNSPPSQGPEKKMGYDDKSLGDSAG